MNSKASVARVAMYSLNGIPTTVKVAAVINPGTSPLCGVTSRSFPEPRCRPRHGELPPLCAPCSPGTRSPSPPLTGFPRLRLGSYLEGFGPGVTHLQKDLRTLEHALGARTS